MEPTNADSSGDRLRGQSDVIAIVLLLGMIFISATAVILMGGFMVESVQDQSRHDLAVDSAVQTHQQIAEALASGEARRLSVTDAVDVQVRTTGSMRVEMRNAAGAACSGTVSNVNPVETDLGSIVYDTPEGEVIYEGGAVWERTDAGLSVRRSPSISYDGDTARIAVQSVSTNATSLDGEIARPDERLQRALARNTTRMLRECPSNGFTEVNISLTSPYHELWAQHFHRQVDTTPNVTVSTRGDTVFATIENATTAHASRGLRFDGFHAPRVVGPNGPAPLPNHFNVTASVTNDDFRPRNATVELVIDGNVWTSSEFEVPTTGNVTTSLPASPLHRQADLVNLLGLQPSQSHPYTVRLLDDDDDVVSTTTGRFFLEDGGGGNVTFFDDSHTLSNGERTLSVNATLINTFPSNATGETVEFQITDEDVDMPSPVTAPLDVPAYGGTKEISFDVNVSSLPAGTYDYQLRHRGVTLNRTFTISTLSGSGTVVGDLRVESIDPSAEYVTVGDPFNVSLQLYNTAQNATTADVSLDLPGDASLSQQQSVQIPGGDRRTVTLEIPANDVDDLPTRQSHDYNVTIEHGNDEQGFPGSFVLLYPGSHLLIEENSTTRIGDDRWINVTLANHGMQPNGDNVTFSLYDADTGDLLGSTVTDEISLGRANATVLPFRLNESKLGGSYEYEVVYGSNPRGVATGEFTVDGTNLGNGNVSITTPGNGSVTVLGTEVSGYDDGYCWQDWFGNWDCTPSEKQWSPITVSTVLEINGTENANQFVNHANDDQYTHDEHNLNTFDTQTDTFTYDWSLDEGETANLTVRSRIWSLTTGGYQHVHTRSDNDPSTPDIHDEHPPESAWDSPARVVDASQGSNVESVRVLGNGDAVPNVNAASDDQRSAAEVLNQGAADRVHPNGTLDLGPNEAIFLFEMTDDPANYGDMWQAAHNTNGDPDYNDVITLVSFNPDNPGDVQFHIGDHSLSIGPAPDDPQNVNDTGEQQVNVNGTTQGPGSGGAPSPPQPQNPDPGSPSEPDEVDVDVGGIVIG
ncbi:archaeal flagellin-like protein [Salinarchaeum sp. Harcht-Bsk1]|uniref:DUF7289 family protein n=1 Tax=Salinarchaeum sp. Harcht-Bsk1 TaxID=1333523 RepID=UPI0003422F45|nr:hypothetical protein [Salinarchaeum sp. Harcht-Bsk1]AGN01481.1 archaeal flagellin-like protein [Salinarchaeum sp. Harcht-Bsk1]